MILKNTDCIHSLTRPSRPFLTETYLWYHYMLQTVFRLSLHWWTVNPDCVTLNTLRYHRWWLLIKNWQSAQPILLFIHFSPCGNDSLGQTTSERARSHEASKEGLFNGALQLIEHSSFTGCLKYRIFHTIRHNRL